MKSEAELIHEALGFKMPRAPREPKKPVVQITARELQIIKMICQEKPVKQIAAELFLTEKTVKRNTANIRKKIGCQTAIGIVVFAVKKRLFIP